MAREIDTTGVVEAGLDSEEFRLVCKCEGDSIDLLLDTGTVLNLVPEKVRERLLCMILRTRPHPSSEWEEHE